MESNVKSFFLVFSDVVVVEWKTWKAFNRSEWNWWRFIHSFILWKPASKIIAFSAWNQQQIWMTIIQLRDWRRNFYFFRVKCKSNTGEEWKKIKRWREGKHKKGRNNLEKGRRTHWKMKENICDWFLKKEDLKNKQSKKGERLEKEKVNESEKNHRQVNN